MPSFGGMDLRLGRNCNTSSKQNFAELGNSYELPDGIEKDTDEASELLLGTVEFTVDEIEVFKVEITNNVINARKDI
jgi:hypothetical protein